MDYMQSYQLDIMLVLTGICGLMLFFSVMIRNLSSVSRTAFILINANATILLIADRFAYLYRGDPSTVGYWMVRITNFLTFFCIIGILFFYNMLIKHMLVEGGIVPERPKRLVAADFLMIADAFMLVVSQFTGLYYTFDETNHYQRAPLNFISFIIPLVVMIIQLTVVIQYRHSFRKSLRVILILFDVIPIISSILQLFIYGLSITNITASIVVIVLYITALRDMNERAEHADTLEMDHLRKLQQSSERLLNQTATALIDALDAKETYTQGHSVRVAKYAKQLAEAAGKDEKEQTEIYYAALLHDIGKIAIPDEIINKKGALTAEEYAIMKQHPVIGRQILAGIEKMPYLSIGANFHHERYDGTGYPEGLKGEEIPELGRILAVADAYDAMSSQRSYRDAIPQQKIREEFIKNSGTQFDPKYAKLMQHLIDLDSEFQMKEMTDTKEHAEKTSLICGALRDEVTDGVLITSNPTTIRLTCVPDDYPGIPSFILFDSLDGLYHEESALGEELNYFEYASIRFDGETTDDGVRKLETQITLSEDDDTLDDRIDDNNDDGDDENSGIDYEIVAVRYKDHALFTIKSAIRTVQVTLALPDNTRFMYAGITGENCQIHGITIQKSENPIGENYITRIAEEISYIKGPAGDVPNVQIDGYRTDASEGIPLRDGLELHFHTMSLPTARLIWHTAFIDIYTSDNKQVNGPNHKEFALIRLDGEFWEDSGGLADNQMEITRTDDFTDWDDWKDLNKKGMDVVIRFKIRDNQVTTMTENAGIRINNVTTINTKTQGLFVTLTGDQVALTQIHVKEGTKHANRTEE
ncbi:MAG: HD-GYP domain-containing protein [Eubacterium sp.]|nr:HD-GYP domain-containing protein [Eubacterium sp.]